MMKRWHLESLGAEVRCDFDSGNLGGVEAVNARPGSQRPILRVWPSHDCADTEYETHSRTWFYFGVKGLPTGAKLEIEIVNMNNQKPLFGYGMKPVFRTEQTGWSRVPGAIHTEDSGKDEFSIRFAHVFFHGPQIETFFAFCHPYTFSEWERRRQMLETRFVGRGKRPGKSLYFHRDILTYSLQKRPVDILTVTSDPGPTDQSPESDFMQGGIQHEHGHYLFPQRKRTTSCKHFPNKPIIFVSSRVHPGETPASFCFDGFLDFLLDENDPRACILRQLFVFKLVPILNPDGVALGHYRADTLGQNLNRFYHEPKPSRQPSVAAVVALTSFYARDNRFYMYLDMHAHASKRGCFIYGNHFENLEAQVENMMYSRLVALNTPYLDVKACSFSQKNMSMKDSRDQSVSKEGSGRVGIFRATGALRCYTLECNYNCGRVLNIVPPARLKPWQDSRLEDVDMQDCPPSPERSFSEPASAIKYGPAEWRDVGKACAVALLDLGSANPYSRIERSAFHSLENLRLQTASQLVQIRQTTRKPKKRSTLNGSKPTKSVACLGLPKAGLISTYAQYNSKSASKMMNTRLPVLR